MTLRVLLADDHQLFREALRMLVESLPDITVVAEVGSGSEVLERARDLVPDIVCMDLNMPGLDGIEATRQLVAAQPAVRIIALSAHAEPHFVTDMLHAGAAAYVSKSGSGEELIRAIDAIRRNQTYLSADVSAGLATALLNDAPGLKGDSRNLGRREREVLRLLAEGSTSAEIAAQLHIATSTVDVHRRNIMRKLDIHTVAELTKYAIRFGLTST